jgi:hypothetical protein
MATSFKIEVTKLSQIAYNMKGSLRFFYSRVSFHIDKTYNYLFSKNEFIFKFLNYIYFHHLSMKEGSLFCFVLFCTDEIHGSRMLQIAFLVSLESSRGGGVHWLRFRGLGLDLGCQSS